MDSGARNTVVEVDVLSRTGYSTADMTTDVLVATPTATTRMPSVAVESVSSLGLRRMDHTVVANTFPPGLGFQALIGLDFLRGHRFCIDIGAGVIDVDPSEGA